jgi:cGMP-dependent protein kinase
VFINGNNVKQLQKGDNFGELALISDAPRSASIKAVIPVTLWGLDRGNFQNALTTLNSLKYEENKNFIDSVPLFEILTNQQKESIITNLTLHKFVDGHHVVNEGDTGDLFYLI